MISNETKYRFFGYIYHHRQIVASILYKVIKSLLSRIENHDTSMFSEDEFIPMAQIKEKTKFSEENMQEISKEEEQLYEKAKQKHYSVNRHHLEFFENDISKMNIIDILEMLSDWISQSIETGIEINDLINIKCEKYNINETLKSILVNTIKELK